MGDTFNESDARAFYRILGHYLNEWTEIRVMNTEGTVLPFWVQGEQKFVNLCRTYSGTHTIWAGLNPRKTHGGSKADDITRRTTILIDIDYHHKNQPATPEEIEKAINQANTITIKLTEEGHPRPWIDVSGNGVHLLIITDLPPQPDVTERIKTFYKTLPVEVDPKNADPARMCRVTGTYNLEAKRLSHLITQGDYEQDKTLEAYLTSNEDPTHTTQINLNTPTAKDKNTAKRITRYKAKMRPCIRAMLTNENEGAHGQSGELDHEAHLLIVKDAQYNGLGYDEICTLFINQPDYKPKITRELVGKAITDNAEKGIIPWYCNNLIKRNWCTEDPELCGAVRWDPDEKREKKAEPSDKATELVNLAHEHAVEFFRDQYKTPYAVVKPVSRSITDSTDTTDSTFIKVCENPNSDKFGIVLKNTVGTVGAVGEAAQTLAINSKAFKWWLSHLYHDKAGGVIGKEYINSASMLLEAETQSQPIRYLYNRFAPNGDFSYWWDMADSGGRAIHIDAAGWEIRTAPRIFIHYDHMMPLPEPERTRDLSPMLDYLNLEDPGDKLLAIVGNISRLVPEVPRIGSVSTGLGGSGKSTWDLLSLYTLDPSSTDLLTIPTKDEDLIQVLERHAVAIFDNVGSITRSQSDIFCRAITGAGVEKRELYTTNESYIRQFMHVVGFNGVSMPVERGDLFSRVILLTFKKIGDDQRKTFSEMKALIKRDAPQIIGAMLTVLVGAIGIYPMVKSRLNVRMSDYVRWGCAITVALGLKQSDFEDAYRLNILGQDEEAVRASLVAEMIIKYMTRKGLVHLEGSATELKEMLEVDESVNGVNAIPLSRREGWPKGANKFGRDLSEVAANMEGVGYHVVTPKRNRVESRKYTIDKIVAKKEGPEVKGQRSFETVGPDELTDTRLLVALVGKVKDV